MYMPRFWQAHKLYSPTKITKQQKNSQTSTSANTKHANWPGNSGISQPPCSGYNLHLWGGTRILTCSKHSDLGIHGIKQLATWQSVLCLKESGVVQYPIQPVHLTHPTFTNPSNLERGLNHYEPLMGSQWHSTFVHLLPGIQPAPRDRPHGLPMRPGSSDPRRTLCSWSSPRTPWGAPCSASVPGCPGPRGFALHGFNCFHMILTFDWFYIWFQFYVTYMILS